MIEIILNSKSKSDVCRKLDYPTNGRGFEKVNNLLLKYGLPLDHFNLRKKYDKEPKYCKNCGDKIPFDKKRNDFCSSSCSASYNNKERVRTEDSKNKTSESLKDYYINNEQKTNNYIDRYIDKSCLLCGELFTVRDIFNGRRIKYCSDECRSKASSKRTSLMMKERVKNGLHKGWASRNTISYPERFFISVLKNNKIFDLCAHKYPCGGYFLDFYFSDKKIDLEIDGKQHKFPDRVESDIKRDIYLKENNIKVYRIEWKSINNEKGKKYIKNEIIKFLKYYNEN